MGVVIALVSKVAGVNNLNLTTTRGDRLIEARPPRCGRLRAGFDQATSYTKPWGTNHFCRKARAHPVSFLDSRLPATLV
jgi:hypothetical protein